MVLLHGLRITHLVSQGDRQGAPHPDGRPEHGQRGDDGGVATLLVEDNLYGDDEEEHDAVDEGRIQGDACAHGLGEQHLQRTTEVLAQDGIEADPFGLVRMPVPVITGGRTQVSCLALEEDRMVCLGQPEASYYHPHEGEDGLTGECPSP